MPGAKEKIGELVVDLKGIPIPQVLFAIIILSSMQAIERFLQKEIAFMWQFLFGIVIIASIALLNQRLRSSLFSSLKDIFENKERKIDIDEVRIPELREDVKGTIEFRGVYSKLLDILPEMEVTPVLRIEGLSPFKGNCTNLRGQECWKGKAVSLSDEAELKEKFQGTSEYRRHNRGEIEFSFYDIRKEYLDLQDTCQNVELLLELYVGNFDEKDRIDQGEPKYVLHLANCKLNILDDLETLKRLVELDCLKTLPPTYSLLHIGKTGEDAYYTNICFIAKKFVSPLEKKNNTNETSSNGQEITLESRQCCTLLNSLTRLVYLTLKDLRCIGKSIEEYTPPEPSYEFDLNSTLAHIILNKIKDLTPLIPSTSSKVILSTFHTEEFEEKVRSVHAQGVCLFGFSVQEETWSIKAIFDFSVNRRNGVTIWDRLDTRHLSMMKEDRRNVFQEHCEELHRKLYQENNIGERNELKEENLGKPMENRLKFPETVYKLKPSPKTINKGRFLTSFPRMSNFWIDLSICNKEILSEERKSFLHKIYADLITRIISSEESLEDIIILNLCVNSTSLSDGKLTALWDVSFGKTPVYLARFNEHRWEICSKGREGHIHQEKRKKTILISAFDSHTKEIRQLVKKLEEEYQIKALCLMPLISLDDPLSETRQRIAIGINRLSIFRLENGVYVPTLI